MATEIDVEDENILTAIFKDSFPESWQDNPDFVQYLVELSSHGAERLSGEPDRLQEEKAQILAETQDLAFHNYSTFIQTADCSKEIFQDFQIIEKHLGGLIDKLPDFSEECNKVILKAQEISSSRRMNSLTLQRHNQLLEVLEMPQLMDTCVRNGYYEEALELAAHVKRLERKHPNIPVIMGIVKEVKWSTQLMLNQLIQQLRTNLQLPACLRVIGFLRRMDVFTEAELRIKFLQARDSWFQGILEAIPTGDPYTHISKTVEASRVHLFDIMTQFRAIFSDEDPLVSTGRSEDGVNESLLFHSWVMQKISNFLATLEDDLERGVGGRLDSILGQCLYFGLSFSRVGADFRGLLAPIFERAALRYFQVALVEANSKFEENMQSYNLLGLTTTGGLPFGATQSGQLYPPSCLLDFYPLAVYCNATLTAFNDLRLCAPLNLAGQVLASLQRSLLEVNRVILAFHRAEESAFNQAEKEQFEHFCGTYATDLLPYLNKCLQVLFPPQQLATALGLSLSEVHRKNGLGQLDIPGIIGPLQHLMPSVVAVVTISASQTPESPPVVDAAHDESHPADSTSHQEPITFTVGSDANDEPGGETLPPANNENREDNNINTPTNSTTTTNTAPSGNNNTQDLGQVNVSTDSGVASGAADGESGLTDSGLGSNLATSDNNTDTANINDEVASLSQPVEGGNDQAQPLETNVETAENSSVSNVETDVSEPTMSSTANPEAQQPQQPQLSQQVGGGAQDNVGPTANLEDHSSSNNEDDNMKEGDVGGNVVVVETTGGSWGGWGEGHLDDLGDLDEAVSSGSKSSGKQD